MDFGTLIFIVVLAIVFNKLFFGKKKSSVDDSGLTDTQKNFRQIMAKDQLEKQINSDGTLMNLFTPHQQKILEMSRYITENTRPFNFFEWMVWAPVSQFVFYYTMNMLLVVVGWILLPIFMGWPISIVVMPMTIALDLIMYQKHRYNEVVKWDPEFTRKFGGLLDELKQKYK